MQLAGSGQSGCPKQSHLVPCVCVCVCVCVGWGGAVFIHEEGSESQQEQLGVVTALNSLFGSGPCYCGISVHLIMPSLGGR